MRKILKKQDIGKKCEDLACEYLRNNGYEILERNFSCKLGEIDIIAKNQEYIVFIEVKTRSSICYGKPSEAVDDIKKKHIYRVAKFYIQKHNLENEFFRFDVIEVYLSKDKYKINLIKQIDIK